MGYLPEDIQNGTDFDIVTPISCHVYENAHHQDQYSPKAHDQPSLFFHSRCPLCFGRSHTKTEDVQVIICCNANFQLKQIKDKDHRCGMEGNVRSKDPTFMSPRTVFLSKNFVQNWKDHVETICPPKKPSKKRRNCEGRWWTLSMLQLMQMIGGSLAYWSQTLHMMLALSLSLRPMGSTLR